MKFNEQQQSVIEHPIGQPALVLAGAGSGKTATIIERAVQLLNRGALGKNLVILTFTNKAVQEIRERLVERVNELGIPNGLPEVETYHSFGYKIIKKYRSLYFSGFPTLMTESDIDNELGYRLKQYLKDKYSIEKLDFLKSILESGGASYIYLDKFENFIEEQDIKNKYKDYYSFFVEIIQEYERFKQQNNMLDFSDLINLPIGIIIQNEWVYHDIQKDLRELMVDESQDTNYGQFIFLKFVTKNLSNVIMIGDDDQSIYEWRGAKPAIMGDFKRSVNAKLYKIESNYRSLSNIVNISTQLIRNNNNRLEKNPIAIRKTKREKIPYRSYENLIDMSEKISKEIKDKLEKGQSPNNISILYRTNRIGNFLQLSLIKHRIPFEIRAGSDILSKPENKLITSMMRLSVNPNDVSAFKTLGEFIPGVGKATIHKAIENAKNNKMPLLEQDLGKSKSKETIDRLNIAFKELYKKGPDYALEYFWEHFEDFFNKIIEKDIKSARKTGKDKGLNDKELFSFFKKKRENNTKLIFSAIKERLKSIPFEDKEERWREALSLIISPPLNANAVETNKKPRITLSTIHAAKGLQWEEVYIAGFSEGLMPLYKEMDFKNKKFDNLEEERRLAYVAFTRAKDNLILCHTKKFDIGTGGINQYANKLEISSFAKEIKEYLELEGVFEEHLSINKKNSSNNFKFKIR